MMMLRLLPSAAARFRRVGDLRVGVRFASWLPLLLLLLAGSTMYLFSDSWGRFDRQSLGHDWDSAKNMSVAENLSPAHNFLMFLSRRVGPEGDPVYEPYNRFPVGGYALIKLVILPFGDDLSAKLYAARMLMLLMFAGAAGLAYLSLRRITGHCWIALAATLAAFSGYYVLYYSNSVSNEIMMDLFAVLLVFHGMTVFIQEGRFGQLLAKTGLALLLGWHVYALLLPFIVLGLGGEIIRALRRNGSGDAVIARIRSGAAALMRSRYLRLGAVALMFGLMLLGFNFANEYAALGGETPLRELPSVRSMLLRTTLMRADGMAPSSARRRDWGPFLGGQFERIGRMVLPTALTIQLDGLRYPYPHSRDEVSLPYRVVGMSAAGACLLGLLLWRRHRILLATLALFGLCWGLGVGGNTDYHFHEAVFYVGLPLSLFTLVLLGLRRQRRLPAVAAVAALLVFALSNYQMSRAAPVFQYDAEVRAEFQEIRGRIQDKKVYVQLYEIYQPANAEDLEVYNYFSRVGLYYLTGSVVQGGESPIRDCGPQCGRYYDFVISGYRNLFPEHLLTPSHRHIFLFDAKGIAAQYRSWYEGVVSGGYGEPVARGGGYDLFMDDDNLIYYKSGCRPIDTADRFYLHLIPEDESVLPGDRKRHGFESRGFDFVERGEMYDGNCLTIASLPDYPIARIRTGQYVDRQDRQIWGAEFQADIAKHSAEYDAVVSGAYGGPAGRGDFDVYWGDTALVYLKETCAAGDIEARFFIHWFPADDGDLPPERGEYGFDNAGFWFPERGVMTGGRCVAMAPLPDYPVDRIRTGQFVPGEGQVWAVEFGGGR